MVPLYVTRPLGVMNGVVGGTSQVYSIESASNTPAIKKNKQRSRTFTPCQSLETKALQGATEISYLRFASFFPPF